MSIETAIQRCAVIGAAGKMGRGISLLLLQEMARSEVVNYGASGTGRCQLILIDSRFEALIPLKRYLRGQLQRYAEKQIFLLRGAYAADASLTSNGEIITAFVEGALDSVSCSTELAAATSASLIFEALPEDLPLKSAALRALHSHAIQPQHYFSNTSSIPIWLLNQQAQLQGTIIGFHFYNPPPIQKLLELVTLEDGDPVASVYAHALAARFDKTIVAAADFPGFIGNGYFMREITFAYRTALELKPVFGWPGAIYAVDWLTRELLIRPMGIFELIDYVGIDICSQIAATMGSLLHDSEIIVPQITALAARGIRGGCDDNGRAKDGFFRYDQRRPVAVYDDASGEYVALEPIIEKTLAIMGPLPQGHSSWKAMAAQRNKEELLAIYFNNLVEEKAPCTLLAVAYLKTCRMIAIALIESGTAANAADIETVLKLGFQHLYSPLAAWMPAEITGHISEDVEIESLIKDDL